MERERGRERERGGCVRACVCACACVRVIPYNVVRRREAERGGGAPMSLWSAPGGLLNRRPPPHPTVCAPPSPPPAARTSLIQRGGPHQRVLATREGGACRGRGGPVLRPPLVIIRRARTGVEWGCPSLLSFTFFSRRPAATATAWPRVRRPRVCGP